MTLFYTRTPTPTPLKLTVWSKCFKADVFTKHEKYFFIIMLNVFIRIGTWFPLIFLNRIKQLNVFIINTIFYLFYITSR